MQTLARVQASTGTSFTLANIHTRYGDILEIDAQAAAPLHAHGDGTLCGVNGCPVQPCFNLPGESKGLYCKDHMTARATTCCLSCMAPHAFLFLPGRPLTA